MPSPDAMIRSTHKKVLILGGTLEARQLALRLVGAGHAVTTSLAGRTKRPDPLPGDVRIGGFGGAAKLGAYLKENEFDLLIDSTHPFAPLISDNAQSASRESGVELIRFERPPWNPSSGDHWLSVHDEEEAARILPPQARAFVALGWQHLAPLETRPDCFFLLRMVGRPAGALLEGGHSIVLGKPSLSWREEAALLTQHRLTHLICRNSGGDGAYAKILAARELAIPVVLIERPRPPPIDGHPSIESILSWVARCA